MSLALPPLPRPKAAAVAESANQAGNAFVSKRGIHYAKNVHATTVSVLHQRHFPMLLPADAASRGQEQFATKENSD